jgi:chorismate synthase
MNSFGRIFRVSIFGESHGNSVGILIDGIPAGIAIDEKDFRYDLDRRKSGARGTTPRKEADIVRIMSGVFSGYSTGAPVLLTFENTNTRSSDYLKLRETPRPGHADYVASVKFGGYEDYRGGGHFSGRLTLGLVAAGVIARKIIAPVSVNAMLVSAGGSNDVEEAVNKALEMGDSIGGIVECVISGVPPGLGEPFFDSAESMIAHMIFSIPAIKGIEFGAGFAAAGMRGSEHNDRIISSDGKTASNHAGGINGGITNGNDIVFRIAVKPTSSISVPQATMNMRSGELIDLKVEGRHDTCIALRVPVVAEAAAAIVMADMMMMEQRVKRVVGGE